MALDVRCYRWLRGLREIFARSHALSHLPLPSSGWLMRILRSIVAPSATLVAFCDSKMTGCGGIRSQLICDELVWDKAIFLQQLAHQFKRRPFVPPSLDQHIEDLALGVDGAPHIDHQVVWGLGRRLRRSAATIGSKWFTQRRMVS